MDRVFPRPQPGEYTPHSIDYISLVPDDGRILAHLEAGISEVEAFVSTLPPYRLTTPHAPGEWSVQDVLQHVIDNERVFAYRALRIARGDTTPLPGYEQDPFAEAAAANDRPMHDLLEEYRAVRAASITLLRSFTDETLSRAGTASDHPLTVCAAAYIIAGHELYHLRSLRENYGS